MILTAKLASLYTSMYTLCNNLDDCFLYLLFLIVCAVIAYRFLDYTVVVPANNFDVHAAADT
jgi:hypothetical protein